MRTPDLCVSCKGTKKLCGLSSCPLLNKVRTQYNLKREIKEEVFGPSNEVFVGSYGYPNVSVGPMVSTFGSGLSPKELYGMDYDKIVQERVKLIRGKRIVSVGKRIEENMQEVALSTRSVDVEMKFTKKPYFDVRFSSIVEPMGASAPIKNYLIAENPKIPKKVDSVLGEDMLAVNMIDELYSHGFDNYYLTKMMSVGSLGKKENKRIVPTRFSITALHDIIAKQLMDKIRGYPEINEIQLYENSFLSNFYYIILMPGKWEFENFESWTPKTLWAQGAKETITSEEYEPFGGRTKYADKQVGGYYSSRFSVVEFLNKIRKQARVVVIREIKEGYIVPVGCWQIKEGIEHAFLKNPIKFQTIDEVSEYLASKLEVSFPKYRSMSKILCQSRLDQFF